MSDVLERFLRYVQVDSQSDPENADVTPSTPTQHDMARMLEHELELLGLEDVERDEHAYVTASLPATPSARTLPAVGLIAHMDTSSAVPASNVKPHIVRYEGGDLVVGEVDGKPVAVRPEDCPDLEHLVGQDIVCSDGTTLLSADDKAGIAIIMALVAKLKDARDVEHPTIKVAFVPDEEIGHGASLLELHDFGATWAYTLDGGRLGEVSYETFNAAEAKVVVRGNNVHPGYAKDIMVNAATVWREFDALLPQDERPEHTEGREGYFHCTGVAGNESELKANYILRDFDKGGMARRKQVMLDAAAQLNERFGEGTVDVALRDEYENMAEAMHDCMFLVENAIEANREAGVEPIEKLTRGGTDGAQLTMRGLPCPNLAACGFNFHSVREFVPVAAMEKQVEVIERLVSKFAVPQR